MNHRHRFEISVPLVSMSIKEVLLFLIARRSNNRGDPPDDFEKKKGISEIYMKCPLKIYLKIPLLRIQVFLDHINSKIHKNFDCIYKIVIAKYIENIRKPVQILNGLFAFKN